MSFGDVEQKTADRFRDLFNVAWARGAAGVFVYLTSLWVVGGAVPAIRAHTPAVVPRPLTWWRYELRQMGVEYPRWLANVTSWHAPVHAQVILIGLCAAAVAASLASRRLRAPGYELGGLLALVLSAQWFGAGRTVRCFAAVTGVLVAAAVALALCGFMRDRLPADRNDERVAVRYSFESIMMGLLDGPVSLLLAPIGYPLSRIAAAVRFFSVGGDGDPFPREVEALSEIRRRARQYEWNLAQMPADDVLRAAVALQVMGRSDPASTWARVLLLSRGASGAVPLQVSFRAAEDRQAG